MKNWYQIMLDIPLEKPDPPGSLPSPVRRLVSRANKEWIAAGSPASVALFKGEYVGFSRQRFFLPPNAPEYWPNLIAKYDAYLVEEPGPHRLLHKIAGSDEAFDVWCPWVNRDCVEYPPLRSGTFSLHVSSSDEASDEEDRSTLSDDVSDAVDSTSKTEVSQAERNWALEKMRSGHFGDALPVLVRAVHTDPDDYGNWYMAGQCYRFTDDIPKAIDFLKQAARLNATEPEVFLALGIAFQQWGQFNNAVGSFVKALALDPNYELAYNSLGLTQMKKGEYEFALHNYDEALNAMTRRLVTSFQNTPARGITKFHDSTYSLWGEYAVYGMMFIASSDPSISKAAWPTGEFAQREERDEEHEGVFWKDQYDADGKKTRMFLPNFFNMFESRLHESPTYSIFLRAKGTALEALSRDDEAEQHYAEAEYFRPR
jgi:tetratricopeptide (TPR) repeat protein